MLKNVKDASERRGLPLNTKKTKIMGIDPRRDDGEAYKIDEQNLEKVTGFQYLGLMINTRGDCSEEKISGRKQGGDRYGENLEKQHTNCAQGKAFVCHSFRSSDVRS